MPEQQLRLRALVGLNLPSDDGEVRVEAGKLVPKKLEAVIPDEWVDVKVEVV